MTLLQTIELVKSIALAKPNIHTFARDFLDLNREDIEYSAVVLQDRNSFVTYGTSDFITLSLRVNTLDPVKRS